MSHSPALKLCVPLIGGIIAGWYWHGAVPACLLTTCALLLPCLLLARFRPSSPFLPPLLFLLIAAFGFLKITLDGTTVGVNNIGRLVAPGRTVLLRGAVEEEPRRTRTSIRFVLRCDSATADGVTSATEGSVLVSVRLRSADTGLVRSFTYGTVLRLRGRLWEVNGARNPGEFDYRQYLAINDIYGRCFLDSVLESSRGEEDLASLLVYPVRRSIGERIGWVSRGEEAQFLKGLILGERAEIDPETKSAFITSGVMHILAVSGLHVTIVVFMLLLLFTMARIPERARIALTCILLVYYNYLTGSAPSVSRSVIMAILFLVGRLLARKQDLLNTLALSAVVLLLLDARQLFHPGFQLSFVAVLSLITLYPKLIALRTALPVALAERPIVKASAALIAVSVASGLGTLPFTAAYFGRVSLVGVVSNMFVVPLSNLILALGMFTVGISYFSSWLGSVYGAGTELLTRLLLSSVSWFAAVPHASVAIRLSPLDACVFYLAALGAMNLPERATRRSAVVLILLGCNLWVYGTLGEETRPRGLRLTMIDVGQGDACLLECPDGRRMLIDAGPRTPTLDCGASVVLPLLRRMGIGRLDLLLVTHAHSDHLGGVPAILRGMEVGEVIDADPDAHSALYQEYLRLIDSLQLPRTVVRSGSALALSATVRCYVLHPAEEREIATLNNQSVVLKVCYGRTSALLAGDAEWEAEERIALRYGPFLHSGLLKVAHHGSNTSTSTVMLAAVRPAFAVVSVGANNTFHHPSPVTLRRLAECRCAYFRTDEQGAVIVESDGEKWRTVEWRRP